MNDRPLDEWRETMIAALYDELDADAMRAFRESLDKDPERLREWRELEATRAVLRAGDVAIADVGASLPPAPARWSPSPRQRRAATLRPLLAAAAGFAAAALLFAGLLAGGLRIDRTPGGVLVRFGGAASDDLTPAAPADRRRGDERYISRAEFAALTDMLAASTSARLDVMERRQIGAQAELAQALYDGLAIRQQQQYDDLRARLDYAVLGGATRPGAVQGFERNID